MPGTEDGFADLIAALTIFARYAPGTACPTHCEHDELRVMVDPAKVSASDIKELESLGFHENEDDETFVSFRFGSA